MDVSARIRKIKLFSELDQPAFEQLFSDLSPHIIVRHVPTKYLVVEEDDVPTHLIILLKGGAKWTSSNMEGKEYTMATTAKPCILTLLLPAVNRAPHFARITTTMESELAIIPLDAFLEAMERCPSFKNIIFSCICRRAIRATNLSDILRFSSPHNRIASILLMECTEKSNYTFRFPFNISDFAYFLNLARPTLSKELHAMEAQGLIELGKQHIRVPDTEALRKSMISGNK